MAEKTLKDGITTKFVVPYLIAFLVVSAVAMGWENVLSTGSFVEAWESLPVGGLAALGLFVAVLSLAIQNILPRSWKEVVVFWRIQRRLPGFSAFTSLAPTDHRVDGQRLARFGGRADMTPEQQNELWYRWYNVYHEAPSVRQANRQYLAFRDLACVAALTVAAASIVVGLSGFGLRQALTLGGFTVGCYLLFMIVARNKSRELVANVLALKSAEGDPEPRILRV